MRNGYKIVWSDEALENLEKIIHYLESNWTEKELKRFFSRLEKRIRLISQRPQIFPESQAKSSIKKSVLSKQTTIYYKIGKDTVEIVTFFDNRQNPEKLKLK